MTITIYQNKKKYNIKRKKRKTEMKGRDKNNKWKERYDNEEKNEFQHIMKENVKLQWPKRRMQLC